MALTIALWLSIFLVVVMALREIYHFQRNRNVFSLRRLTLRLCMSGMLLFALVSILIGVKVFGLNQPLGVDLRWAAFWVCIVLLVVAICCLVVADFTMVRENVFSKNPNISAEISEIIDRFEHKDDTV